MSKETAVQIAAASLRFGVGATREVGMDLADLGLRRVLVFTDPGLVDSETVSRVRESIEAEGVSFELYDSVRVEPTDGSFKAAIAAASAEDFDAFIAVGGGSVIDTAKAANLYATYPADFMDYVNAPIGKAVLVPGPLRPLIAIPTTAGTGSETTGSAIFDLVERKAKTGITHPHLKPSLAIVDPDNVRTVTPGIAACTGLDVLCHAIEAYTAVPFTERPGVDRPKQRPAYQGSNSITDVWALESIRIVAKYIQRVADFPVDDEVRTQLLLASSFAGIGFGNAGCHLPHAMSYPVSGMVRDYRPPGYVVDEPLIPHGMSVVLNAPAAFRFTAAAVPDRHLHVAALLGADVEDAGPEDAGMILSEQLIQIMKNIDMPNGLQGVGYSLDDVPALVEGAITQHRLTKLSPRSASQGDMTSLFEDAMTYW
jgi:hydroxyacid-oxoacid transhydrogenase